MSPSSHLRRAHHCAAQHRRLQVRNGRYEVGRIVPARLTDLRKLLLLCVAKRAALAIGGLPDHTAAVGHEDLRAWHASLSHEERRRSHVSGARPVEEEDVLLQLVDEVRCAAIADPNGTEECGDRDRGRALDIIIVCQVFIAILGEQRECVVRVEILKLEERHAAHVGREQLRGRLHELVDEFPRRRSTS